MTDRFSDTMWICQRDPRGGWFAGLMYVTVGMKSYYLAYEQGSGSGRVYGRTKAEAALCASLSDPAFRVYEVVDLDRYYRTDHESPSEVMGFLREMS